MSPDLSYYVGMHGPWSAFCHTPEGVATVCMPVSLLVLALLLRFSLPLTVLLPEPHRAMVRSQLQQPGRAAWISWAVAALSILLGAASHVLWDSFTHQGRLGSEVLPWLEQPVFAAMDRQFRITNLLQHMSTAAGVAAIAAVYWRALRARRQAVSPRHDAVRNRLLLVFAASAALLGALSAHALTATTLPAYVSHLIVRTVVWSTSCFVTLFIIGSLAWWYRLGDG